jgi:hypothetical protein
MTNSPASGNKSLTLAYLATMAAVWAVLVVTYWPSLPIILIAAANLPFLTWAAVEARR